MKPAATSFGRSISTGPGRPSLATRKASATTAGMSAASRISQECFTIGRVMPMMSTS